nr:ribosome maturation factor RimM [Ktedonobacteraceae bacterium]
MPEKSETEWATIGIVVAPFGVRGELKVLSLTDIPNRFAELETIHLGPDRKRYSIKSVRPYKGEMVVMKLAGIEDANVADTLRNLDLTIPIDQLAKLPPDSYYQHDILGLQVVTLSGRAIGTIVDIIITGSNDVYVLKADDGKQVLIPAIKDVIKQVDLIRKMMYIEPIPGLLEEDETTISDEGEDE